MTTYFKISCREKIVTHLSFISMIIFIYSSYHHIFLLIQLVRHCGLMPYSIKPQHPDTVG